MLHFVVVVVRFCIFNKLPGNANAAGPQTLCAVKFTTEVPLGVYRAHR